MSRASFYVFWILALSVAASSGFADEALQQAVQKVADLEREIIDFKMARADSWMFWMAAFMTFVAVLVAVFGIAIPVLTSRSVADTVKRIESEHTTIRDESQRIRKIREHAEIERDKISDIRGLVRDLYEQSSRENPTQEASTFGSSTNTSKSKGVPSPVYREADMISANQLWMDGKIEEAEEKWLDLADDPKVFAQARATCWTNIGNLHSPPETTDKTKLQYSLDCYSKALLLDSGNIVALNNRSIVFQNLERFTEALQDLDRIITLGQADFRTYANRGAVNAFWEKFSDARNDFLQALEMVGDRPEKANLLFQLGTIEFFEFDLVQGFARFEEAKDAASENEIENINLRITSFLEDLSKVDRKRDKQTQ